MKEINIGIIGLGTVGTGVFKILGSFPQIKTLKIAVKNLNKKRNIEGLNESLLTDNPFEIVNNPEIDVVVEVMGGIDPAFELLKTAIENGKHIVTANKELLAKYGKELFSIAKEKNVVILYEAAVAGGIPIIMPIKTILGANKIEQLAGIVNGTTNYILTKMTEAEISYEQALKEATDLGYAETDPTGDVEGFDAVYKLSILAAISFNKRVDYKKIYREGITKVRKEDIATAKELGYRIKLIALAREAQNGLDLRVHPMFVKQNKLLANINGVTNSILLKGFPVGEVVFTGAGAGEMPTASSVVGDILDLATELKYSSYPLPLMRCKHEDFAVQVDINETYNQYYISLTASNNPGAIGVIGTICGNNNINLSVVLQKGTKEDNTAEIVVITETSKEFDVQNALRELVKSDCIKEINSLIRVMN